MASNPMEPSQPLLQPETGQRSEVSPQAKLLPGDSAVTKAEKIERHATYINGKNESDNGSNKRIKLDPDARSSSDGSTEQPARQKGVTPIKKEYLIAISRGAQEIPHRDDDDAEAAGKPKEDVRGGRGGPKNKGGQNHNRSFGSSRDVFELCRSRALACENDPITCRFGDGCRHSHDIRNYLAEGKRKDLDTFEGKCPVFEASGVCVAGWRCRFASSHSREVVLADGIKNLVQITESRSGEVSLNQLPKEEDDSVSGVVNIVSNEEKVILRKKKHPLPKSDVYLQWLDKEFQREDSNRKSSLEKRAEYVEAPLLPSEKRRIYYGPETPVLAPLTTQGNLPFRQLCVGLGAQVTWSEMAMGLPLINGEKAEWALIKAHESETLPPAYNPKNIVLDYDNTKDIRFGAQIAANKPWLALKTTEVLTDLCPKLRAIDLNCGCPIDLVCRTGAGSALLDHHGKLAKMLRGMNTVSGEVPITVKIRMGTKDKSPNADKLCQRLILGGTEDQEEGPPAGVAAITLHGRSRQQRYSRSADWDYIAQCASLVEKLKAEQAASVDTSREPDARDLPAGNHGLPYFCGNGDVLSHVDYRTDIEQAKVDTCMIGRGALIKPWIFEEIETNQYLDKSASERLAYIERFVRNGLQYWGSDEVGVGNTRRFLLEWLSFSCRYVPIGILEYLPPKFGDRPPAFHGRSELETLLSSANYKDWIKISEMFLGPAHKDFHFQPKHKSNSYEIQAEG